MGERGEQKRAKENKNRPTHMSLDLKKFAKPIAITLSLSYLFPGNPAAPCLPIFFVGRRMLHDDPGNARENRLGWKLTKLAVFSVLWCAVCVAFGCLATLPGLLLLKFPIISSFHSLFIYTPFVIMSSRADRNTHYVGLQRIAFHVTFDIPLTMSAYFLREVFGLRLFTPFATILDEEIIQGSMPFPSDVKTLKEAPYNVCAVVNMTYEYHGPKKAYKKHGVKLLNLNEIDTCAPSLSNLRIGAAFIKKELEMNPGKRVFIHCKGGIGRATTMSLAHYYLNQGKQPAKQVEVIQKARSIVMKSACEYNSITEMVSQGSN